VDDPLISCAYQWSARGRTLGLVWRASSARLREFRLLAATMRDEAGRFLGKLHRQ